MIGTSSDTMDPNGMVTREQMFVMLGRALNIEEQDSVDTYLTDLHEVSDYAAGYVNAMIDAGYIKSIDNTVSPSEYITRASVMSLLDQTITTYACEDGATVEASGSGITLVAADSVTVTGIADTLIVAGNGNTVTVDAAVGTLIVSDDACHVTLTGNAAEVTVLGADSTVVIASTSRTDTVTVDETAVNSEIIVEGTVGSITTAAESSVLTVCSGAAVDTVIIAETASGTTVNISGIVTSIETAAENTSVTTTSTGYIESVTIEETATGTTVSGADNTVSTVTTEASDVSVTTVGTLVSASENAENVTAGSTTVTPGDSEEVSETTSSSSSASRILHSSSSSGSSSKSSHTHSYTGTVTTEATCVEDGVITYTCSCGDSYTEAIPATGEHSYTYTVTELSEGVGVIEYKCTMCGEAGTEDCNSDEAYSAAAESYAAAIGNTVYSTLEAALKEVVESETVVLIADVELTDSLSDISDITFDGRDHTITISGKSGLFDTVTDCTIENITLNADISSEADVGGIANTVSGDTTISDVTVTGSVSTSAGTAAGLIASINDSATVNITNCTNSSNVTAENGADTDTNVAGIIGVVNSGAVVHFDNVTSAGDISGSTTKTGHVVNAGAIVGCQNDSTVYIDSATITAECTITVSNADSSMTDNVGVYVAVPVRTLIKNTKCKNQSSIELSGNGDSGYVAQVEDYDMATLTGTIAAANNGATVTLNDNVTLLSTLTIPEGKEVVLDLNGKTIEGTTDDLIINNGTLTVKDSSSEKLGTISTSATNMFKNAGSLMIESGTYKSTVNCLIYNDGSSAIVIIKDGSFMAAGSVIYNNSGNVTIDGGTFKASSSDGKVVSNQNYIKINGGTFTGGIEVGSSGALTITGGTFSVDPSDYVDSSSYTVTTNGDGSYTVTQNSVTTSLSMQVEEDDGSEERESVDEAEEAESQEVEEMEETEE